MKFGIRNQYLLQLPWECSYVQIPGETWTLPPLSWECRELQLLDETCEWTPDTATTVLSPMHLIAASHFSHLYRLLCSYYLGVDPSVLSALRGGVVNTDEPMGHATREKDLKSFFLWQIYTSPANFINPAPVKHPNKQQMLLQLRQT